MGISIPERPPLLMGRASFGPAGTPQRPTPTEANKEQLVQGRPATQAPAAPEFMGVPMMAASLFQGAAPKEGEVVELVCVRADAKGWGLALRVKEACV